MNARCALGFAAVAALGLSAGCGGVGKSQSHLRSAIDAQKPTLDTCYERALKRNRDLAGTMTMWVHLTKKGGAVSKVEVTDSTVNDLKLTQCVETTLIGTQVSPSPKANLKVEYQLEFTPKA